LQRYPNMHLVAATACTSTTQDHAMMTAMLTVENIAAGGRCTTCGASTRMRNITKAAWQKRRSLLALWRSHAGPRRRRMVTLAGMLLALLILIIRVDQNWLEWLALMACCCCALPPSFGANQFRRVEALCGRLARKRGLSLRRLADDGSLRWRCCPDAGSATADHRRVQPPAAGGHVAHGRLANPAHPMWQYSRPSRDSAAHIQLHVLPAQDVSRAGQLLGNRGSVC